jgi:hypothetical protein
LCSYHKFAYGLSYRLLHHKLPLNIVAQNNKHDQHIFWGLRVWEQLSWMGLTQVVSWVSVNLSTERQALLVQKNLLQDHSNACWHYSVLQNVYSLHSLHEVVTESPQHIAIGFPQSKWPSRERGSSWASRHQRQENQSSIIQSWKEYTLHLSYWSTVGNNNTKFEYQEIGCLEAILEAGYHTWRETIRGKQSQRYP